MSAPVEIRPYESDDHAQVVDLWNDVFQDDPPWNEPTSMIRRKLTVQPEGRVHHLAVRGSHRHQGIASSLMIAAEKGLEASGCPKVNLQVRATNNAVIAFYRSLGYEVEERASLGKRLGEA